MPNDNSRRWAGIFFFTSAMIFGLFMYQIARNDPAVQAAPAGRTESVVATPKETLTAQTPGEKISMQVDQAVIIGRSKIVYRGLSEGRVRFDHYLLDDNPHYAFAYAVPEDKARNGFKIGTHALKVTYAGGKWVHFKRLAKLPDTTG